ncbi:threonine aldolase family protein [Kitasatospora sp. NPDC052896]|uniref:threonine aldolase family protein n=1 Tax=Kitasatospora sp. NPDC052896 TaxID=3364061 RepID=UPI0037C58A8F
MSYEQTAAAGAQRFTLWRDCRRILSGRRPETPRERLAELTADAAALAGPAERPDFYGDGIVATLERRVAELLGKPAALFFPTGTMAQQVALRCWARRRGTRAVATHPLAHLETHERRAYQRLSGLHGVWPTTAHRLPTAAELRDFDEEFGILLLELPLREAGFVLPEWPELVAAVTVARDERRAVVHLDGARLWESAAHYARPLPELAALGDSVYVSFYKALGGLSGAALAGPADLVRDARAWRHRYGGLLYQQWPTALAALAGLDRELPRLPGYLAHARVVAEGLRRALRDVPGARLHPDPPHTHQFQLWLPYPARELNEAGLRHAAESGDGLFGTWSDGPLPGLAVTELSVLAPALEWQVEDVRQSAVDFLARLPTRP